MPIWVLSHPAELVVSEAGTAETLDVREFQTECVVLFLAEGEAMTAAGAKYWLFSHSPYVRG